MENAMYKSELSGLIYSVLVIVCLLLFCHLINKYLIKKHVTTNIIKIIENNPTSINIDESDQSEPVEHLNNESNLTIDTSGSITIPPITQTSVASIQTINLPSNQLLKLPRTETEQTNVASVPMLENLACDWKMDKVKQFYKKGENVYLPASLGGKLGYVGRDYLCYRHKVNDQDYIAKRGGCMVCNVDLTNANTNGFAGTNIINTCVFGSDDDALLDSKILSRKKCETICDAHQDKTN